ncbi:hypothetical protein E1281_16045 [Actinomadura sp. KC345]|uniref:hypothetical protein n=1 Tax=Actinomadura sp. KC345 TaxID=2530371 RepID=UPI00104B69D2|nr:hypothetical protein [Actinomadura sp. KC345]TDC54490.1 hypothetical protein E1281_16045 [Actinomadura sp. KC345]
MRWQQERASPPTPAARVRDDRGAAVRGRVGEIIVLLARPGGGACRGEVPARGKSGSVVALNAELGALVSQVTAGRDGACSVPSLSRDSGKRGVIGM